MSSQLHVRVDRRKQPQGGLFSEIIYEAAASAANSFRTDPAHSMQDRYHFYVYALLKASKDSAGNGELEAQEAYNQAAAFTVNPISRY
jgi:hypothetical protein